MAKQGNLPREFLVQHAGRVAFMLPLADDKRRFRSRSQHPARVRVARMIRIKTQKVSAFYCTGGQEAYIAPSEAKAQRGSADKLYSGRLKARALTCKNLTYLEEVILNDSATHPDCIFCYFVRDNFVLRAPYPLRL